MEISISPTTDETPKDSPCSEFTGITEAFKVIEVTLAEREESYSNSMLQVAPAGSIEPDAGHRETPDGLPRRPSPG
jgi:hypothetical protein